MQEDLRPDMATYEAEKMDWLYHITFKLLKPAEVRCRHLVVLSLEAMIFACSTMGEWKWVQIQGTLWLWLLFLHPRSSWNTKVKPFSHEGMWYFAETYGLQKLTNQLKHNLQHQTGNILMSNFIRILFSISFCGVVVYIFYGDVYVDIFTSQNIYLWYVFFPWFWAQALFFWKDMVQEKVWKVSFQISSCSCPSLAGSDCCRGARVAHGGLSGALIYQQYAMHFFGSKSNSWTHIMSNDIWILILSSSIFFSFLLPCRCFAESRLQGNGSGCWQFQKTWRRQVGVRVRSQTASYLLAAHWCLLCLVIWVCNKQSSS